MVNTVVYSQDNVDSVICKYLIEIGQFEKGINTTKKVKEGVLIKKSNYFFQKKPIMRLSNSVTIQPIIFGCYKSHARKFLLIQMKVNANSNFYFYGNNNLVYEIEKLREEVFQKVPSLKDEESAALINYLSSCYL